MYKHQETVAFLQSIIGQEIKVYTIDNKHEENFIGKLKGVTSEDILVDCKTVNSTKEKLFFFFNKKVHITKIVTTKDYRAIYKVISVSPEALADIRNTLGPLTILLNLLQSGGKDTPDVQRLIEQQIQKSEAAVEYLSNLNTF